MMKVIVDRGLHDLDFLRDLHVGWEEAPRGAPARLPPGPGRGHHRHPAADVEKLALMYGATKKSFIRVNWGIQRHDNGGMMTRAIKLLPAVTGAMAGPGGVCMSTGGEMRRMDMRKLQRTDLLDGRKPRMVNMIRIGEALNDRATWIRRSRRFSAGTPIRPTACRIPQSARRGLSRDDLFTVVHDTFWTDSTALRRHRAAGGHRARAHGPAGGVRKLLLQLSEQAIEKQGESLDNQELFRRLAKAMGYDEPCFSQSDEDMFREVIDPSVNPLFEGISFDSLKRDGWARAAVDSPRRWGVNSGKWPTPSGKIEIRVRSAGQSSASIRCRHAPARNRGLRKSRDGKSLPVAGHQRGNPLFHRRQFPARAAPAGNDRPADVRDQSGGRRMRAASKPATTAGCSMVAAKCSAMHWSWTGCCPASSAPRNSCRDPSCAAA